jgi:hypothetical protein
MSTVKRGQVGELVMVQSPAVSPGEGVVSFVSEHTRSSKGKYLGKELSFCSHFK